MTIWLVNVVRSSDLNLRRLHKVEAPSLAEAASIAEREFLEFTGQKGEAVSATLGSSSTKGAAL